MDLGELNHFFQSHSKSGVQYLQDLNRESDKWDPDGQAGKELNMSFLCSNFFCSYMPEEQACSTCPVPSSCPNHSSKAFTILDFETFINEAGGMYTQENLHRLNILFFRWQESIRKYNNQPKKRTTALKYRVVSRYSILTRALQATGCC